MAGQKSPWVVAVGACFALTSSCKASHDPVVDAGPTPMDAFVMPRDAARDAFSPPDADVDGSFVDPRIDPLVGAVDDSRYMADLVALTGPREPGSAKWQADQDLCASRFAALGYDVTLEAYRTGVNVIGTLAAVPGSDTAQERVYVSAHYDHFDYCDGADDNASGVAGVLEAARVLAMQHYTRTLVVACWDEEERALLGSAAHAIRDQAAGVVVAANLVFEMIGYKSDDPGSQMVPTGFDLVFPDQVAALAANDNRGDFIAFVSDDRSHAAGVAFERYAGAVGLPVIRLELAASVATDLAFYDLQRSDHAAFWFHGMPGVMLTDTADFRNTHYHCMEGPDTVDRLDPTFARKVIAATVGTAASQLGVAAM